MTGNLSDRIRKYLPAELVDFLGEVGKAASELGLRVYLVGGAVRDLMLGQTNLDLDVVVEGSAIGLAQRLAELEGGKVVTHTRFGTAKLRWKRWSIDFATARSETYSRPGALPEVMPSNITADLFRRDFTINAMAVYLSPERYGELLDPYGGEDDLRAKLIRILHEKSFVDDATRIWRALRYEQRLDFHLEEATLQLLQRDTPMLDTISADRIRYEMECILQERYPEKVLRRADELGVLPRLHRALTGDGWLAGKFEQARRLAAPGTPPVALYLALMSYHFRAEEIEDLIQRLNLPRSMAQVLREVASLRTGLGPLADPLLSPSGIYRLLHSYSPLSLTVVSIATDLPVISQRIRLFLDELRQVKPALTGDDLARMGIAPGPDMGLILGQILEARLDGKISTRQDEERLVSAWLSRHKDKPGLKNVISFDDDGEIGL